MLEINQFKFSFFNRTARSDNRLVSLGSYFFSRRWIVPRVRSIERQSRFRKQKKNLTFSVHFLGRHRIRVVQSPVRSVALAGKGNGLQKKKKSFQSKKKKKNLKKRGVSGVAVGPSPPPPQRRRWRHRTAVGADRSAHEDAAQIATDGGGARRFGRRFIRHRRRLFATPVLVTSAKRRESSLADINEAASVACRVDLFFFRNPTKL